MGKGRRDAANAGDAATLTTPSGPSACWST
jgi:hypothetical protein